ncbi:hypothetical protein AB0B89_23740 [Sphaerisporangium sp. NPDC049002]|uniref:hypothetical protein n=1 Tax=Sphaerisporangium sp. NPDC049002 TaxID=3155392 RepID=UPI0033E8B08F
MDDDTLNGLTDGTFRARWIREVLRSPQITESIKVLLVSMAIEEMDAAGRVSVPREDLATRIGRGKARISERLQEAVDRGFLVRVSAGKRGSTAVYAGVVNGSACADPIESGKGPATRTESSEQGPATRTLTEGEKGPDTRTRTKFGSGLQDAIGENRTKFGSGLQDAIDQPNAVQVRVAGPNDEKKGPHTRAAKVEGSKGEVELPPDSADEDFLKTEDAASRRASRSSKPAKRAKTPKIPLPPDFAPDEAMLAWARENCPLVDIDGQTAEFKLHFTAEGDEKPEERPGWSRSWKAWMLRHQGWTKERTSNVRQLRPTGTVGRPGANFATGSGARAYVQSAEEINNAEVNL